SKSPDEEHTSEDVVESPYMGTIRSKGITQLLLLGALDIIQGDIMGKPSDVKLTQESFPVEQVKPKNRTLEDLLR
ncbi:hypothetical protein Tco_0183718, partial [Tanacetum coccineum]